MINWMDASRCSISCEGVCPSFAIRPRDRSELATGCFALREPALWPLKLEEMSHGELSTSSSSSSSSASEGDEVDVASSKSSKCSSNGVLFPRISDNASSSFLLRVFSRLRT